MRLPIRLGLPLAALGAVALAWPSSAASAPKPQVVDVVGDANAINGEGLTTGVPDNQSTPVDISSADITSITLTNLFKTTTRKVGRKAVVTKTPTGMTVRLGLAAAASPGVFYRVTLTIPGCGSFWLEYDPYGTVAPQAAGSPGTARCAALTGSVSYAIPDVKTDAKGLTWTLPSGTLGHDLKPGQLVTGIGAQTRGDEAALVVPQIDDVVSDVSFRYGR